MQADDSVDFVIIGDAICGPADKDGPFKSGGEHIVQWFRPSVQLPEGWTRKRGTMEMAYPRPDGPIPFSFGPSDQEAEWDAQVAETERRLNNDPS